MKQFYCTICRNPAEVVATSIQPGEFGSTRLINLECPTCSEHISCVVELPVLTAQQVAQKFITDFVGADRTKIVNDVTTEDSPVEHNVDVDVSYNGYDYNVSINVNRFGKSE